MITQRINLNLIPGGVMPRVNVSQYDFGSRILEITLYNGVSVFNIPSGSNVFIQGTKKDGRGFQYENLSYSGSVVTADITQQMTVFEDEVVVELVIVSSNEKEQLATANFILNVEPAALKDDVIISETDIPTIQTLPEAMAEIRESVTKTASDVISADENAYRAEAWAKGTKDGVPVTSGQTGYQDNALYYKNQADASASDSAASAATAASQAVISASKATEAANSAIDANDFATAASGSAVNASASATAANASKEQAEASAMASAQSANLSESYVDDAEAWARGTRNNVDVDSGDETYHNNSKYYSELASINGQEKVLDAEAWAVGQRGGIDVESTDPTYENNSKFYKEQSASSAAAAAQSYANVLAVEDEIDRKTALTVFNVDFTTGELIYTEPSVYTFTINRTTGNLEWEVA